MAYLDPQEASEHFQGRVLDAIRAHFPLQGRSQSVHLKELSVKNNLHPDDIAAQHKAKMDGGSWTVPVYGQLELRDNETGKVIDSHKMRLAEIPKMTRRYSYIMGGQEYQVDNQWQLKPGVYTRRAANGELESMFNVASKPSYALVLEPDTGRFLMKYGKSKIPLYPIMKTMGVDDDTLEKAWGKKVLESNKLARGTAGALERFYKADKKAAAPSLEAAKQHVFDTLSAGQVRPEATTHTLGKAFSNVSGEVLRLATERMLKVQAGHPEDDRDNLVFKELRTAGDFAHDKIRAAGMTIRQKFGRNIQKAKGLREVVKFEFFNKPLQEVFHNNAAVRQASQINPVEMVASAGQTTIMGPGGIQSEQAVTEAAKFVNPSHLGFLDPINTPEGEKTGITLRLPLGVKKVGNEPRIPLYDIKSGKMVLASPSDVKSANVVLPDQVEWKGGKPVPRGATVRMNVAGNEIKDGKMSDAQYVMRHPSQLFNVTSNLIPFLNNTSGGRASMASRHIEQSISLVHREPPMVQVSTGVGHKGIDTFENLIGRQSAHLTPVDGTVHAVTKDHIIVSDKDGDKHEVQLYRHYPLNDAKSVMHSTPLVKVGDKVHSGQVIADTNFTKGGTLALGTNLRVGYVPFKGYNFEDGIVISESAANKLASEHLHKHALPMDADTVFEPGRFATQHPGVFKKEQFAKVGDDGVVKVGSRVKPGDPLIVAMKPFKLKDRTGISAIRRSLAGSHTDKSLRWDSDFEGEVVATHRSGKAITVHVKTIEPMQVGDKMAGRYGNKGIVTMILPDHEMPHTGEGKHIEVALNPSGVPGRMNVGQVLETAAAKIVEKTKKPYLVRNFEPHDDVLEKVRGELKAHGLSDTEELHDPVTGKSLGQAMVGPQHMLKLVHQVDKKMSVRSGMALPGAGNQEHYDLNLQPTSGAGTGGQSMGVLGMYAMLAHGAKANIREMQTWKSEGPDPQTSPGKQWQSQHNQVWAAIQTGHPLPTPQPTFAFQKFTDLLRGAGVNIEKKGHHFTLSPLTDKHILHMSAGALPAPTERLQAKGKEAEPKPRPGGLFDEKLTGGLGGRKWSHISLAEPMPNPLFERPICRITGITGKEFAAIVQGEKGVTPSGHITDASAGLTGGAGIKALLDRIDVKRDLAQAKKELTTVKGAKLDPTLKKVKYLQALDQLGLKPSEAYVLHNLPVLPPVMRPVSILPSGDIKYADVNGLYAEFAQVNDKLKDPVLKRNLTDPLKKELRRDMYDGVKAIMGVGIPYADAQQKGILHQVSGAQPKTGYFQDTLMNRRQDLTMRSTIVPEPALGLDEVGLPRHAALDLFRPFVVKKLRDLGHAPTAIEAQKLLTDKHPSIWKALEKVVEERPVLLKRDPALHKHSVQAFKPRLVSGSAIQIHPLVTGGYNADFDGDTMSVFVPVSQEAVAEAHKMMPSNNLFSEATGKVVYQPTLESALGLYKLSLTGKEHAKKYAHEGLVVDAVRKGQIHINDVVHTPSGKTTAGRVLLASALPESMQKDTLHNLDGRLDRKGLDHLLSGLAKNHAPEFGEVVNRLKDLGNGASYGNVSIPPPTSAGHNFVFHKDLPVADAKKPIVVPMGGTHTLSLEDFATDKKTRHAVLGEAQKKVNEIYASKTINAADKDRRAIHVWTDADHRMQEAHEKDQAKDPSNLFLMYKAGVKPNWTQYKQMVLAPMLLQDSANRTIPTPVTRSYAEGLDVGGYWTQMHGARRGAVMKVQEVQEPGYMSKLLMNNMMHMSVNQHDCGTKRGIAMDIGEHDVHDRHLAEDFQHGNLKVPTGTLLSPDVIGQIKSAKKDARVIVRSPLKCEDTQGLCQKCVGIDATGQHYHVGTNIGVQSAHAVGERAVQLTLKAFHTGGVQERGGGKLLSSFARFQQLTMLPETIPDAASLAMTSGKVTKIEKVPTGVNVHINGKPHFVGRDSSGMPLHEVLPHEAKMEGYTPWHVPVVGQHYEAGDHLSDPNRTTVNPHHLYAATGNIEKVQNHMATEIHDLYKSEGVKRRTVETVVKAMGNLTKVEHPGDHHEVLRGEFRPLSVIRRMNAELVKSGKDPIEHKPVLRGLDMLPLSVQEDWMAKLQHQRLRGTIMDAAATGTSTNIHGASPVPGMAFGAEFGLTKAKAKTPGFGHLKDVPEHVY